ncbi:MAG: SRPBCC family protein [Marmoricola sp.]|nr:SRPBCC family protein [Marmoricola sp.]
MLTVEESIVIDKPCAEVFAFFTDPDSIALYASNISDYKVVSGENTELGRKATFTVRVVGVKLDYTDELVEFEDGKHYKLSSSGGRIPYTITMDFEDQGESTKVTWHQESESLGSVFKFADGLVIKMYAKDLKANLENAKTMLEA